MAGLINKKKEDRNYQCQEWEREDTPTDPIDVKKIMKGKIKLYGNKLNSFNEKHNLPKLK